MIAILISKAYTHVKKGSHSFTCLTHVRPQMERAILPLLTSRRASPHFGWSSIYSFSVPLRVGGWLLLARIMGQYCFAGWPLSSSVVVCNAAGVRAGRPPGAWTIYATAAGRVGQYGYVPLGRHFVYMRLRSSSRMYMYLISTDLIKPRR